jgi:hypothetical protein
MVKTNGRKEERKQGREGQRKGGKKEEGRREGRKKGSERRKEGGREEEKKGRKEANLRKCIMLITTVDKECYIFARYFGEDIYKELIYCP